MTSDKAGDLLGARLKCRGFTDPSQTRTRCARDARYLFLLAIKKPGITLAISRFGIALHIALGKVWWEVP